jgi:hypothetical protein
MARRFLALGVALLTLGMLAGAMPARSMVHADNDSFLGQLAHEATLASTVPANGDVNPYGVAVAPRTTGNLVRGNVLVSNFNASSNAQGTGTTIVQISPSGTPTLFAQIDPHALPGACPGGVGLTTALVALRSGFVIVGSLPTADGTAATAQAGCLIVLNSLGKVVETIAGPLINGPWDMTAVDAGTVAWLFVTNVLNGTVAANGNVVHGGTVVRIALLTPPFGRPIVVQQTVIGSGFAERTDPSALVIGPTGVGIALADVDSLQAANIARLPESFDTLYVADSVNNRIAAIPGALVRQSSAGTGITVSQNGALNDPLGLALAPNNDILTMNGNDGNIVETTPFGKQVAKKALDTTANPPALPGAGTLFGLALFPDRLGIYFVDDGDNTLRTLR